VLGLLVSMNHGLTAATPTLKILSYYASRFCIEHLFQDKSQVNLI